MIKFENIDILNVNNAMRAMRNPHNSWDKSDTVVDKNGNTIVGEKDDELSLNLSRGGSVHAKHMRQMFISIDITAPLYWWKEFDTYRMGVEKDSCSTMHTIMKKKFELSDFSYEHLDADGREHLKTTIDILNGYRRNYIALKNYTGKESKSIWYNVIQLLPSSYNQMRTLTISYEALANMYYWRRTHPLDEWRDFCSMVEGLDYSEFITVRAQKKRLIDILAEYSEEEIKEALLHSEYSNFLNT